MTILILPLLNVSGELLGDLKKEIGDAFLSRVEAAAPLESLPDELYDSGRRQYDAGKLIPFLDSETRQLKADKIIAVGNIDLFMEDLNFVFGAAQKGGRICAISLYRLDRRFYGKESRYPKLRERAVKEAIHELAHCHGLEHCGNKGCVMSFSNDIVSVDQKSKSFCEDCRERLRDSL